MSDYKTKNFKKKTKINEWAAVACFNVKLRTMYMLEFFEILALELASQRNSKA